MASAICHAFTRVEYACTQARPSNCSSLHVFLHPPVQRVRDVDVKFRREREKIRFAELAEGLSRFSGYAENLAVDVELQEFAGIA